MAFKPIEILINAKDNASAVFGSLQTKIVAVGATIASYFGVKAFVGVVEGAADFEQAMSRVKAATGASADEMAQLKKAAQGLEDFGGVEAALALENLGKAGLSASESIAALGPAAALAKAGGVELGVASEVLTQVVFGLGLSFNEAARVADVLAGGANATKTSVAGLAQGLSYAAPVAKSLGLSLEFTVALLGQFAQGGIDASRAGTALNSIMSQFLDPASKFRNELAAAGITTSNFEDALHQLAKAGPAGSKAINAVGTEAGPALRAALNLGVDSLDKLVAKLRDAEGEVAKTAAVMRDNLNGSVSSLGKAWEYLTNTLGAPVLPVLKDGVDQLAGAFRAAVQDGTVTKFGEAIAAAFQSGITWIKAFAAQVDFTQLTADLRAFADRTGEVFTQIGEYATNAGNIVKLAYGVMSAGTNAVLAVVHLVGEAFAGVASNIQTGLALMYDSLAKISFGSVSAAYKKAADEIRLSAEATWAASEALAEKSRQAFVDMSAAAETARTGYAGLAASVSVSDRATAEWQKTVAAVNVEMSQSAAAAAAAGAAYQKKAQADQSAKQAADEHRAALAQLRAEYAELIAKRDLDAAAKKLDEVNKALARTPSAAKNAGKAAKEAADAIAAAYKDLGITTDAELKSVADRAKGNFDRLAASGTASARELGQGFADAAAKAIAANNGIAPSWVEADAAARGYRVEVDGAGKATIVSMSGAKDAVTAVGKAVIDVSAALKQMGIDAATASQEVKDLAAAGQMLAAAEKARRDAYNKDLEASKFMNRPNMNPIDQVPTFNSREEAEAWFAETQKQYQRNNPFTTNSGGALGNMGMDTIRAEYQAELDALAKRDAMKNANGGQNLPGTNTQPGMGVVTKTIVINLNGVSTTVNTDDAGESAVNNLIRQLGAARGTSSIR